MHGHFMSTSWNGASQANVSTALEFNLSLVPEEVKLGSHSSNLI